MSSRAAAMPPVYRWLAEYYDQVFTGHPESAENVRRHILGDILPRVESACDLACGTGTTALLWARRGIRMTGVDLAPAMCRQAREKARAAGLPLRGVDSGMRDFRLPVLLDLVMCEFDALNHVPRKSDLARVARSVWGALKPGGHFYFDVNNRMAFEKVWPGTWWIEKPRAGAGDARGLRPPARSGMDGCRLVFQQGRFWRRAQERVEQVAWTAPEIRRTFRAAGFGEVRAWDATPLWPGSFRIEPGVRTYYRMRKPAAR